MLDVPNDNLQPDTVKKDRKKQSRAAEIWKRFRRSKLAMVGFVIIVTAVSYTHLDVYKRQSVHQG